MTGMSDETGPLGPALGPGNGRGPRGGGQGRGRGCRRGWSHEASPLDWASAEREHSALKTGEGCAPAVSREQHGPRRYQANVSGPSPEPSEWHRIWRQFDWLQKELGSLQERIHQLEVSATKPPGSAGPATA